MPHRNVNRDVLFPFVVTSYSSLNLQLLGCQLAMDRQGVLTVKLFE